MNCMTIKLTEHASTFTCHIVHFTLIVSDRDIAAEQTLLGHQGDVYPWAT